MFECVENRSQNCPRSWFKFKPIGMNHSLEGEIGSARAKPGIESVFTKSLKTED